MQVGAQQKVQTSKSHLSGSQASQRVISLPPLLPSREKKSTQPMQVGSPKSPERSCDGWFCLEDFLDLGNSIHFYVMLDFKSRFPQFWCQTSFQGIKPVLSFKWSNHIQRYTDTHLYTIIYIYRCVFFGGGKSSKTTWTSWQYCSCQAKLPPPKGPTQAPARAERSAVVPVERQPPRPEVEARSRSHGLSGLLWVELGS